MWWKEGGEWLEQLVGNLLWWGRENMMMNHPAPQGDSPSTAAFKDHKKGDLFPGAKEGWVWVHLGQSQERKSLSMWMELSKFGPKHPASGIFFLHTTEPWELVTVYQRPSQILSKESKETAKQLPPHSRHHSLWPGITNALSAVWLQHSPELASIRPQEPVGFTYHSLGQWQDRAKHLQI